MNLTVINTLGSGGFGFVELVKDVKGNTFARKTFSVAQALSPEIIANVRKRFAREVRTQSGLRHRNIVPVLFSGLESEPPFYLMPPAECSLQDDLSNDKTLNGRWMDAISDIVAALETLHAAGVYHRDLKPQNVLKFRSASEEGRDYKYAVSDFGLVAMNETRVTVLTSTGMAKGTDFFTAPEITADLRQASVQSDVYSLGCMLHEMVGTHPRIPCNEIREDGPFGAILLSCTRTDPSRRFSSARSFLDAVVAVATGLPVVTTPAAAEFAEKLDSGELLEDASWQALITYVEDNEDAPDAHAVLARLQRDQISDLCSRLPQLGERLAAQYTQWVHNGSFPFERCDSLANILDVFVSFLSFEAKSDSLMAMLELGTTHNRWYVERKFFERCSPSMDDTLARRVAIEIRAAGNKICEAIEHLERSIGVERKLMHPILSATLAEICQ